MRTKLFSFIFIVVLSSILSEDAKSDAKKAKMNAEKQRGLVLCLDVKYVSATVLFNDWPILSVDGSYPIHACPPVTEWAVSGPNEVSIRLHAPSKVGTSEVKMSLENTEFGAIPGSGKGDVYAKLEWSALQEKNLKYPRELNVKANVEHSYGTWIWERSAKLTLDGKTMAEATALLETLHGYLKARNEEALVNLYKIRFDEVGPCYAKTPVETKDEFLKGLKEMYGDTTWKVEPLESAEYDFTLRANGRVIELRNKDGHSALRGRSKESRDYFDVFLAKVNNRLAIVR